MSEGGTPDTPPHVEITTSIHAGKYLSGLTTPDPPQPQSGRDGDPQLAALHQFLMDHSTLGPADPILDIGAGSGVLVAAIQEIWPAGLAPRYIAIDEPEPLHALSLPAQIHNNSEKLLLSDFLSQDRSWGERVLVVVRNIVHELDIWETAVLLKALNTRLSATATIYVQDLETLPRAERGNAGWDADCFTNMLHRLGMECELFGLSSWSGTRWFALRTHPSGRDMPEHEVVRICADARREQKGKLAAKIAELNAGTSEETALDLVVLSIELANIELQLGRVDSEGAATTAETFLEVSGVEIPLRPSSERQAFSVTADSQDVLEQTGIAGVLRTKECLDIPRLIDSATRRVYFAGFSNHLTFERAENVEALCGALSRGVEVKVLICDPTSPIAEARASEPVYADPGELFREIDRSVAAARDFWLRKCRDLSLESRGPFEVRLTGSVPPCSYFLADDLCVASFYTGRLSGNVAPSLLFVPTGGRSVGLFEILLDEFRETYSEAVVLPMEDRA